jgi:hypothetical protein
MSSSDFSDHHEGPSARGRKPHEAHKVKIKLTMTWQEYAYLVLVERAHMMVYIDIYRDNVVKKDTCA